VAVLRDLDLFTCGDFIEKSEKGSLCLSSSQLTSHMVSITVSIERRSVDGGVVDSRRQINSPGDPLLEIDAGQVGVDSPDRDVECCCNLRARSSLAGKTGNRHLAGG